MLDLEIRMAKRKSSGLPPYAESVAGTLLAAREAVMAPIRPHLRAANVTEQQWRVLRVLAEAESLDGRTIAEQALLYSPTVTRILKELADRKLIARTFDENDGRRLIVSITNEGLALVRDTAKHTRLLLNAYAKAFGEERLNSFKAEATALAKALGKFRPGQ